MNLVMNVIQETDNSTVSELLHENGDFICFIIEDDHDDVKTWGETRIPGGCYEIIKRFTGRFFDKYKPKYGHKYVLELKGVPNYTAILIHIGNTILDTAGCLLPNYGAIFDRLKKKFSGVQSTKAFLHLYAIISEALDRGERVFITINR